MSEETIRMPIEILLVSEEEPAVASLEEQLTEVAPFQFIIDCARSVDQTRAMLGAKPYDLVLLDLSSAANRGTESLRAIREFTGELPIVVVAGVDDEAMATEAVSVGAQDYIVRGHVTNRHLANSLRHAVTRQRMRERLVNEALLDELTGLYNRRGMLSLGQQQLAMADRTKRGMLMFYVDLDDMKRVNDSHGHKTGDRLLIDVANVFRRSFRKSDVISRIGGDEFAILAVETAQNGRDAILHRLQDQIVTFNNNERRPYHLSMSVGVAVYDAMNPSTIETFIEAADRFMYEDKQRRKRVANPRPS